MAITPRNLSARWNAVVRAIRRSSKLLLLTALCIPLITESSFPQENKRPKLKDFGSSVKRLKWDPATKKAVDPKRPSGNSTSSDEDDVVRIETNLVTTDILVVDRQGNLVENLTADDFIISEDEQPQKLAHFHRGDNASVGRSIVLIFDYSRSLHPFLRKSINAAKLMVDKLAPLDMMAIVTDDVELLLDFTNDKAKLRKALEALVERTKGWDVYVSGSKGRVPGEPRGPLSDYGPRQSRPRRFGKSDQYSALMATLKEAFRPEDLRPIIVFQTEGDEALYFRDSNLTIGAPPDLPENLRAQAVRAAEESTLKIVENKREFGLADVYEAAERSRATIYTVVPGVELINRTPEEQLAQMKKFVEQIDSETMAHLRDDVRAKLISDRERQRTFSPANLMAEAKGRVFTQRALAGVAQRTGGSTEFLETPEQAEGIYNRILSDMNRRYIISYYPTNKERNGARRRIKFEIKGHPEYHILGRNSYYAPADQ